MEMSLLMNVNSDFDLEGHLKRLDTKCVNGDRVLLKTVVVFYSLISRSSTEISLGGEWQGWREGGGWY